MGGVLSEGVQFVGGSLQVVGDVEVAAPAVPMHRVLKKSFVLKSQALMLTYNSKAFTRDTWPAFRNYVDELAKELGASAWSSCLERSTHSSEAVVFHTHAYLLWLNGVGYRSEGLQRLQFSGVRPRVDQCTQGANERVPRRAALHVHGLWYVAVKKLGTEFS